MESKWRGPSTQAMSADSPNRHARLLLLRTVQRSLHQYDKWQTQAFSQEEYLDPRHYQPSIQGHPASLTARGPLHSMQDGFWKNGNIHKTKSTQIVPGQSRPSADDDM